MDIAILLAVTLWRIPWVIAARPVDSSFPRIPRRAAMRVPENESPEQPGLIRQVHGASSLLLASASSSAWHDVTCLTSRPEIALVSLGEPERLRLLERRLHDTVEDGSPSTG